MKMMHSGLLYQYQWQPFDRQATGSNYLSESEDKFALEGCYFLFYYLHIPIGMKVETINLF
jgi:hypothetical protein